MGTYISQSDLNSAFGENNVIQWSNLDNSTTTVDSTRVTAAITFAEAFVQDRLRGGRYTIPFSANSSGATELLKQCMAKMAGWWLYQSRGTNDTAIDAKLEVQRAEAEALLDRIASGQIQLDIALSHSGPTAPAIV